MPATLQYDHDGGGVVIVVDEAPSPPGAPPDVAQRGFSPTGDQTRGWSLLPPGPTPAKVTLDDAVNVVGRLSDAFSKALAQGEARPAEVEISFGLEASAELGSLLVGKASGKANFNVRMTWKNGGG